MKIFLIIALILVFFAIQKSNAYGENIPGVCKHFNSTINDTPVFFGFPLSNGFCPGPDANLHDNDDSTLKHSSAECATIIAPFGT